MLASLSLLPRDSIGQNRDDRRWEERARGNSLEEWSVHVLLKNQSRGVRSVIPERELQSPMQLFSNIMHEPYSCCNINFIGAVVLVIWPKEWNNRKWEAEILEGREVLLKFLLAVSNNQFNNSLSNMFLTDYFFQDLLFIITSYRPDISFQTFLLDQSYMRLTASQVYKIIQVTVYSRIWCYIQLFSGRAKTWELSHEKWKELARTTN